MIDISMHGVTRVVRRNATHAMGNKTFHTSNLTVHYKDWLGNEHEQTICLFSDNPMEIEDADSTPTYTENV
jgi:hypothetical protein